MTREEALKLLNEKIKTPNLIKHCLAVGAIMRGLAEYFNEDKDKWEIAGLLHDIDYEQTKNNPKEHSLIGAKFLEEMGLDKEITYAIKVHNPIHNLPRKSKLDKALFAADPLSGLIVAATLVLPSKKLKDLTVENIIHRFKEKGFARGANRENISKCQELGLSLEKFFEISLNAMREISQEIGL
ncbi:HDIG domain-containing protein [bacterium]|nr:HDIG domain-containing protein [bacterium]